MGTFKEKLKRSTVGLKESQLTELESAYKTVCYRMSEAGRHGLQDLTNAYAHTLLMLNIILEPYSEANEQIPLSPKMLWELLENQFDTLTSDKIETLYEVQANEISNFMDIII